MHRTIADLHDQSPTDLNVSEYVGNCYNYHVTYITGRPDNFASATGKTEKEMLKDLLAK